MSKHPSIKISQRSDTSESSKARFCERSSHDRVTPMNFDSFIPWICFEMQCLHKIVVKRQLYVEDKKDKPHKRQESKASVALRKSTSDRVTMAKYENDGKESLRQPSPEQNNKTTNSVESECALTVNAYYNPRGNLIEVAIVACQVEINRKLIQALNICLPFHSTWTKLTVSKVKLNPMLIDEIAKMLPHSNLTDICFDESFLPEANYYLVLDHLTSIKYLSLKRCRLNDLACNELASRLHYGQPASKTLMILDLGSNNITDNGAVYIGDVLRMNRRLLHINLSDNALTDFGIAALLKHLVEFEVLHEEMVNKRRRKRNYLEERKNVYELCLKDVLLCQKNENMSHSRSINYLATPSTNRSTARSSMHLKSKSSKNLTRKRLPNVPVSEQSSTERAEMMTQKILGDFCDVFDDTNVIKRNGRFYCLGNLVLCSLNLSYTQLELPSLKKLVQVLKYQRECCLTSELHKTGLLRVIVEGNYTPVNCVQLKNIQMYLSLAVDASKPNRSSKF